MSRLATLRLALTIARRRGLPVASAYLRIGIAAETGSGVRLTADEVAGLSLDTAMLDAADNVADEVVAIDDADRGPTSR